jgi:hypothetical protein
MINTNILIFIKDNKQKTVGRHILLERIVLESPFSLRYSGTPKNGETKYKKILLNGRFVYEAGF